MGNEKKELLHSINRIHSDAAKASNISIQLLQNLEASEEIIKNFKAEAAKWKEKFEASKILLDNKNGYISSKQQELERMAEIARKAHNEKEKAINAMNKSDYQYHSVVEKLNTCKSDLMETEELANSYLKERDALKIELQQVYSKLDDCRKTSHLRRNSIILLEEKVSELNMVVNSRNIEIEKIKKDSATLMKNFKAKVLELNRANNKIKKLENELAKK